MNVAINKKVTKDLADKFSEILGCETEVVYMKYCTPVDAELKGIDIVLTSKQGDDSVYGGLFKRPADVADDQITAMVVALGVKDGRWANLEAVWKTYVNEIDRIANSHDQKN